MFDRMVEDRGFTGCVKNRVDPSIFVVGRACPKEPCDAVVLPSREPDPLSKQVDIAVHHVGVVLRPVRQQCFDLPPQFRRTPLVRVEQKDPVAPHVPHRPIFLRAGAEVVSLKKAHLIVPLRDFRRAVG